MTYKERFLEDDLIARKDLEKLKKKPLQEQLKKEIREAEIVNRARKSK